MTSMWEKCILLVILIETSAVDYNVTCVKDGILGIARDTSSRCLVHVTQSAQHSRLVAMLSIENGITVGTVSLHHIIFNHNVAKFCSIPLFFAMEGAPGHFELVMYQMRYDSSLWVYILNDNKYLGDIELPINVEFLSLTNCLYDNSKHSQQRLPHIHRNKSNLIESGSYTPLEIRRKNGCNKINLQGAALKVAAIESWPYVSFEVKLDGNKENILDGFYAAVWYDLEAAMNFTTEFIRRDAPGVRMSNGTHTGILGMAQRKEIDVLMYDITMSSDRMDIACFVQPLMSSAYQVYFKREWQKVEWASMLRPLHRDVWLAWAAWLIVASSALYLIDRVATDHLSHNQNYLTHSPLLAASFFLLQTLCSQGSSLVPKGNSMRCMFLTCYLTAAVLLPIYSGALISGLTRKSNIKLFDSLQEMVQSNPLLLVYYPSADYEFILKATVGSEFEKKIKKSSESFLSEFRDYEEMVYYLCNNASSNAAVFGADDILSSVVYDMTKSKLITCQLDKFSRYVAPLLVSIAFVSDSPYQPLFNYYLLVMRERGHLKRHQMRYFPKWKPIPKRSTKKISILDVLPIFVVLVLAIIFSILVLIIEIYYYGNGPKNKCENSRNLLTKSINTQ